MKLRKSKVAKEEIARLYVEGLLTMQQIGDMAGISKQAVRNILVYEGVDYRGGMVKRTCHYCHNEFEARRKDIKHGKANYCSLSCFHAARVLNPERYLIISEADRRNGNRTARKLEGLKVGSKKEVHHKDGDPTNNDPDNRQVFRNKSEHMAFHHKQRV